MLASWERASASAVQPGLEGSSGPNQHGEAEINRADEAMRDHPEQGPSTLQIVLACRQYAAAFSTALHANARMRSAATAPIQPDRLSEAFASGVVLEEVLGIEAAYRVFREAYGLESWLVAPERGVRSLVSHVLQLYSAPMLQSAAQVRAALLAAADAALLSLPAPGQPGSSDIEELPVWLRQQLLSQAKLAVNSWHADTRQQLQRLLEAEQACPSQAEFERLRQQLQQLLGGAGLGAGQELLAEPPAVQADGNSASKQALKAAGVPAEAEAAEPAGPAAGSLDASYLMGWLHKLNRRGRWQRRWLVLPRDEPVLYYSSHPKDAVRAVIPLAGAVVISESVLPPATAGSRKVASLAFHIKLSTEGTAAQGTAAQSRTAGAGAGAAGKQLAMLTLRAPSLRAKAVWVAQLQAASQGTSAAAAAAGLASAAVLVPLARSSSAASSSSSSGGGGGSEGPALPAVGGGVPRKISTQVFPQGEGPSSEGANPTHGSSGASARGEGPLRLEGSEEGRGQQEQQEQELVDAIARQARQRGPGPEEAAMLRCVVQAVSEYCQEARCRLLGLTQRLISSGMLVGRERQLEAALLGVLLPPGASPPCLDLDLPPCTEADC